MTVKELILKVKALYGEPTWQAWAERYLSNDSHTHQGISASVTGNQTHIAYFAIHALCPNALRALAITKAADWIAMGVSMMGAEQELLNKPIDGPGSCDYFMGAAYALQQVGIDVEE